MSVGTAAVLNDARAVEREVDAVLRQAAFSNPAAVAWVEERFEDGVSPEGDGWARVHPRPMVQLRDDRCDCWRFEHDPDDCPVEGRLHYEELDVRGAAAPVIPSEYARWVAREYAIAHRMGARQHRVLARRASRGFDPGGYIHPRRSDHVTIHHSHPEQRTRYQHLGAMPDFGELQRLLNGFTSSFRQWWDVFARQMTALGWEAPRQDAFVLVPPPVTAPATITAATITAAAATPAASVARVLATPHTGTPTGDRSVLPVGVHALPAPGAVPAAVVPTSARRPLPALAEAPRTGPVPRRTWSGS